MKTPPSPRLRRRCRPQPLLYSCRFLASFLVLAGVSLAATSVYALNHVPFVSWIRDQQASATATFGTQYFRVTNYDSGTLSVVAKSSNTTFLPDPAVAPCNPMQDTDCIASGNNYKITFATPTGSGAGTTITVTVTNLATTLTGATSFTLRRDAVGANNPPTIATLPNYAVRVDPDNNNIATYETMFAIGDLDQVGTEDIYDNFDASNFTVHSSNPSLLPATTTAIQIELMPPDGGLEIDEGPRLYKLTATTNANYNYSGAPATSTVSIDLVDPNSNLATTSFVLTAVPASNAVPTITNKLSTFEEQVTPGQTSVSHKFSVTNDSPIGQLKVTANSSNTSLVPNDSAHLSIGIDGDGDPAVTVTPAQPLPSPGVPQAATITLSVTDDAYTRQTTFLYVLAPPRGGVATSFTRPGGVYFLDVSNSKIRDYKFLSGTDAGDYLGQY